MQFLPSWLNPFDVLIAFAMLIGIVIGFTRGLLRMLFAVAIIYLSTIVAMTFYTTVGGFIHRMLVSISLSGAQALAFLLLLILSAVILHVLSRRTYKNTEWPGIRQIDQLGGLIFGFLVTTLWIGLALVGVNFILSTPTPGVEVAQTNLIRYYHTSTFIPIYFRFLPIAFATLKPWVPKGQLPAIFSLRL
jgi:uncharacterized membrane protein required for colicin V production